MLTTTSLHTLRLIYILAILSNLAFYCSELPLLRLVEQKICRNDLGNSPPARSHPGGLSQCGAPEIQDQLAMVIGLKTTFDAIPPLLTSLWYGSLASKLGYKFVITLACTGELLNLLWVVFVGFNDRLPDVRLAWLAALFLFVGGGQFLLYAMFALVVTDVANQEDRAPKLAVLHSVTLLSSLFGASLSAALIKHTLIAPFLLIALLLVLRYPVTWYLPALPLNGCLSPSVTRLDITAVGQASEAQALLTGNNLDERQSSQPYWGVLDLLSTPAVPFCFLCFLVKRIAFTSEILMYQYIAERLNTALDNTAWVRIPIGCGAAVMLFLVLPATLRYTRSVLQGGNSMAEIWAVRLNLVILILGFVLFWSSSTPIALTFALFLCGAGEGLAPSLQALASSVTGSDKQSDLFATISVIDTIAKLLGGPIMAGTFSIRRPDDLSYGFCFLLSAALFTIILCLSWTLTLQSTSPIAGTRYVDHQS